MQHKLSNIRMRSFRQDAARIWIPNLLCCLSCRPGAVGCEPATDAQPEPTDCSGNGAGRRDGTSTTAVLREQLLLQGQQLCEQHASGTPRLCVEAVAQLLLRLCMFALPCGGWLLMWCWADLAMRLVAVREVELEAASCTSMLCTAMPCISR